jgi:outer membrane protein assembly factor BamB
MKHFDLRTFLLTSRTAQNVVAGLAGAALLSTFQARADWPEFRGPTHDGHIEAPGLPLTWSDTNNIVWKTAIHDRGFSTPVVLGDQVWLTTATQEGNDFFVLCFNAKTGKIDFEKKLFHCDKPEPQGNNVNTYATPTCAIEAGRVYVHFGTYGTACLDTTTHETLWQRDDIHCRHYRGPSSSLVLFENLLILTMDGVDAQFTEALDKKTGKTVWKTNRSAVWDDLNSTDSMVRDGDRHKAHSTPIVADINGKPVLLSVGAGYAYAYNARTGEELWKIHFSGWSAAPCPVYANGLAYFTTGYSAKTSELMAVKTDGKGDVTDTHMAWRYSKSVPKMPTPTLVDNLLYVIADDGILSCLEPATGNVVWQNGLGGNYAASPIYAEGRLYFFSQQGKTTVIKPGREYQPLSTNKLSGGLMASPAVSGKAFFLRVRDENKDESLIRVEESAH